VFFSPSITPSSTRSHSSSPTPMMWPYIFIFQKGKLAESPIKNRGLSIDFSEVL
jgi:hypothetical protein